MAGVSVFFSYSHADEEMRDQLEKHLTMLKRNGNISTFHDREILAGAEFGNEIDQNLIEAGIILLLVSPDFLASEYCYSIEMQTALKMHKENKAVVIPVILDHCDWRSAPFSSLMAVPNDAKPITEYANQNKAFDEITTEIRKVVQSIADTADIACSTANFEVENCEPKVVCNDRSANLHVKKEFTELDFNDFLNNSYDYIAKYMQNTLEEFEKRNVGFQTRFNSNDSKIEILIFNNGVKVAYCRIMKGRDVSYMIDSLVYSESEMGNSFNDSLNIENDGTSLFWKPSFNVGYSQKEELLSMKGAAEFFWDKVISRFQ